jgi:hypothetical protein
LNHSKPVSDLIPQALSAWAALILLTLPALAETPRQQPVPEARVPMEQLGALVGKQFQGDGLSLTAIESGARLRCAVQKLEGHATGEGLWLISTADGGRDERFRLLSVRAGRELTPATAEAPAFTLDQRALSLPATGSVIVDGAVARFIREGVIEEYSASADGVQQDFIVETKPSGAGQLRVDLELTGAKAQATRQGARLVLDGSGRKLAYNRLRVVDARGQVLAASMRVLDANRLALLVDDSVAQYPVRIDPTVSDEDWSGTGGILGAERFVNVALADGAGNVYIGGEFIAVGDISANYIAKWDGSAWSALGDGLDYDVWALALSGTDLYVGGDFTMAGSVPANRIAKWNGTSWSALGGGIGVPPGNNIYDYVKAIAVIGTNVYAAGDFTTAGGILVSNIAKWNGSAWSALGTGLDDEVMALAAVGTDLYAGGAFTNAGGSPAAYIAKWDGAAWSAVGAGVDDWVWALAASGSDLYVGGEFSNAGGSPASNLARWNGTNWSPVGGGVNARVSALTFSGTDLYAAGQFSRVGGTLSAFYVARWNGTEWSAFGSGVNDYVNAVAVVGTDVYVGGDFESAGNNRAEYVARWNGVGWSALGSGGLSGKVYALAVLGTDVYAGGEFTNADVNPANNVARWDGTKWFAVGSGVKGTVSTLKASATDLYVGGFFTEAGGIPVKNIARWDGTSWFALGEGLNGGVAALTIFGTDLVAGGDFTMAGDVETNGIAKWNGAAWTPLGAGTVGGVQALAAIGTNLYAGGAFVAAGGQPAGYIAGWNGTGWFSMGLGMNSQVRALTSIGPDLYAGGVFTTAGGNTVGGIAKWNGSTWSRLGTGIDGSVVSLAASGTTLFAGGSFTAAGGVQASNIAQWDGTAWSALGSGAGDTIWALAVLGDQLFVGGEFVSAGNTAARFLAKATIGISPNISPTVRITKPLGGQAFPGPASIDIDVTAGDRDGSVVRVDFYSGTELLSSDTTAPFGIGLDDVPPGFYTFKATAVDNQGASTTSQAVSIVVNEPIPIPAAPTALQARALSGNRTKLQWIDNATQETVYKIERSVNGKPFKLIKQVVANATSFTDRGLLPGKRYSYRVSASNTAGDSAYSNTAERKKAP